MKFSKLVLSSLTLSLLAVSASNAQVPHNTLSGEEAASGYQLLFNGTDFTGWRSWNSLSVPNSWKIVPDSTGATTKVIENTTGTVLDIVTADSSYQNFDYKIEILVPSAGNSGMFIRYNFYNRASWGGNSGPEMQIAATNNSDGTNTLHRMGTCYDMFPLQSSALNWDKIGQGGLNYGVYQQMRIIAFNGRVAHYGNGIKLLEYDMTSTAYNTAYNASKYKTYPTFRTIHPGGIMLRHHSETGIRFRNIKIKRLTTSPWAEGSVYLANPADSNSGLKSALTQNENLFPTAIGQAARTDAKILNARLMQNGSNYSLMLDRTGEYQVRIDDLRGKSFFKASIRGNQINLPSSAFKGEMRVLRVLSADGSTIAYQQMVSPVR